MILTKNSDPEILTADGGDIETALHEAENQLLGETAQQLHLKDATTYSLRSGGKRLRPLFCHSLGKCFDLSSEQLKPLSVAVEWIHTYSLIHDDLPCMDNDDTRRGQPTNHKVFGENYALLAGDTLLTHAFEILLRGYSSDPKLSVDLGLLLTECSGIRGMIGGQAIDLNISKSPTKAEVLFLHRLKTGGLFRFCSEGTWLIANSTSPPSCTRNQLKSFGENFGIAFQIKDDILDFASESQSPKNLCTLMGPSEVHALLQQLSDEMIATCKAFASSGSMANLNTIEKLIQFNLNRTH